MHRLLIGGSLALLVFISSRADGQGSYSLEARKAEKSESNNKARTSQTEKRIIIEVQDSALRYVLRAISLQSGREIVFNNALPQFSQRVSLKLRDVSVMDVLTRVLHGTSLVAEVAKDGETIVIRPDSRPSARDSASGSVSGTVTDSATGEVLRHATVTVVGTKLSMMTTERGTYRLAGIPNGSYTLAVKLLGYRTGNFAITLRDGESAIRNIVLVASPTALSGVVTTVTGMQRKLEVGNDITTIDVSDVLQKFPVTTMSDLLATRVPGLYAMPTSGQPGAPTRIRIRGISSVNASNEPIIVVDGVQIRNPDDGVRSSNQGIGVGFDFSSIDRIDLNAVETVEVLKGPSAVALYGSDASNGVIVITTKRGKAGPARWSTSASLRAQTIPGQWPNNYFAWGHRGLSPAVQCEQPAWISAGCTYDSTTVYQILNSPMTTVFGRGLQQEYSVGVNGGTSTLKYALTVNARHILGLVKLPDEDVRILQDAGHDVPGWQRRPQASASQGGTATVDVDAGHGVDVHLTTSLVRQTARSTPLSQAINGAARFPPTTAVYNPDGTLVPLGSGLLQSIGDFRKRQENSALSNTNSMRVQMRLHPRLTVTGNAGADLTSKSALEFLANGACPDQGKNCNPEGGAGSIHGTMLVANVRVNGTARVLESRWLNIQASAGGDYVRRNSNTTTFTGAGLPPGATSVNSVKSRSFAEANDDRATAGFYVELRLGIADRFWFPLAIRSDAGSTLGASQLAKFPKLNFSYLISDQPAFQRIPLLGRAKDFRLRTAFGVAGKQPAPNAKLRTYAQNTVIFNNTGLPSMYMASIGNSRLRPEQTQEVEWGFDSELFQGGYGRLNISATWSRKLTRDLLSDVPIPYSVGFDGPQTTNLGDIRNTSFELSSDAIVDFGLISWNPSIGVTQSRNTLLRLGRDRKGDGRGAVVGDVFTRHVPGYPLGGRWAVPIVGYADRDRDGLIAQNEVLFADSAVYIGAPYPNFTLNTTNVITLFSQITLAGDMSYENGMTQLRDLPPYDRAKNDPTVSLREQAYGLYSDLTRVQSVSTLRLRSMRLSYRLPRHLTPRVMRNRTVSIGLDGTNLGLWTSYRGKDPNVGAAGESVRDAGQLPQPRTFGISVRVD